MKKIAVIMAVAAFLAFTGYFGAALYFTGWKAVMYGALALVWLLNVAIWRNIYQHKKDAEDQKVIWDMLNEAEMLDAISDSKKHHPSNQGPMGFLR